MENEILICLEWLDKQKIISTMNTKNESYNIIKVIENWANETISEDAFIEAVRIRNIVNKKVPFTQKSIYIPISEKSIRLYKDHYRSTRGNRYILIPALKRL